MLKSNNYQNCVIYCCIFMTVVLELIERPSYLLFYAVKKLITKRALLSGVKCQAAALSLDFYFSSTRAGL